MRRCEVSLSPTKTASASSILFMFHIFGTLWVHRLLVVGTHLQIDCKHEHGPMEMLTSCNGCIKAEQKSAVDISSVGHGIGELFICDEETEVELEKKLQMNVQSSQWSGSVRGSTKASDKILMMDEMESEKMR
ncbi:hypothetical protein OPV22_005625 [Ensete ventricosum]|uniref:Uncharacterized protein n=1 Tax=Ensete ventricosum TaxID=4639 RepID=A0AAV8RRC0_ENSVE|nr:hypothetical protein OPV22_005625 [Ensete ventricosum]